MQWTNDPPSEYGFYWVLISGFVDDCKWFDPDFGITNGHSMECDPNIYYYGPVQAPMLHQFNVARIET